MRARAARRPGFALDLATSYVAGGLSLVSGLVLLPVAAGTIGLHVYGTWLALSAIQQLVFAIDLGAGTTLVRYSAAARPDGPLPLSAVWALGRRAVTSLGAVQLAGYLVLALFARSAGNLDVDDATLVVLGVGVFAVGVPARLALHVLQGIGHYATASVHLIAGTLVGQSLKVLAMVTGAPDVLLWLAVGDVLTVALPSLLALARLRHLVDFPLLRRQVDPAGDGAPRSRDVLSFAGNNAALLTSAAVVLHGSTLVVGLLLTPGAVALYDAATKVFQGGRRLLDMVMGPLLPWATGLLVPGGASGAAGQGAVTAVSRRLWRGAVVPVGLVLAALFAAAPWLVRTWLGAAFDDSVTPLRVLLAVLLLQAFLVPGVIVRQATNRLSGFTLLHVVWMVATLAVAVPFVRTFGLVGAALSVVVPLVALFVPMLLADGGPASGEQRALSLGEGARAAAVVGAAAAAVQLVVSGRAPAVAVGAALGAACLAAVGMLARSAFGSPIAIRHPFEVSANPNGDRPL